MTNYKIKKNYSTQRNQRLLIFFCFVVWRESIEYKKDKIVVDIRDLNAISQSNVYSIFLPFDILQTVQNCIFILIIDCVEFFYQWKIHFDDRHKLIVIIHREQKTFNVTIMKYRNSFAYVQRQINKILRFYKHFIKTYIDNIMLFFLIVWRTCYLFTQSL